MRRREFIAVLGGAAAWPLAARAQPGERMRRIGLLMTLAADDPEAQARNAAFLQALGKLGWTVGRNVQIDYRWTGADADRIRNAVAELVALAPDVIQANSAPATAALLLATRTVPVVFTQVVDPVGAGFVESLARPGRNATGFMLFEYGMSGKWLELLKEIAPDVTRAAVLRDPSMTAGVGQFAAIQAVAPLTRVDVRYAAEIERAVPVFAHASNGGLIVTSSPSAARNRDLIIKLAAMHRLPGTMSPAGA